MFYSMLDVIGKTPLVRLCEIERKINIPSNLYAKLEYFNPFGSIKDRTALQIINDAEKTSSIASGCILEASSGNLGIALAAISQIKGYKSIIVMPENASESRKILLDRYGAEIILTEEKEGMLGAVRKACEIKKSTNVFYCDQFNNTSSVLAHFFTTAKEIDIQTNGTVDIIVCGIGSGGTVSGLAKYFKLIKPSVKIIGVLPNSHPHKIQGIGAGFIPLILDMASINNIFYVSYEDAINAQKLLLEYTSIFAGISSGAVLACVLKYFSTKEYINKNIVMIFPDSGERYI